MKPIFLLTVQHTGTWWSINTLRTHPEIGGFAHIRNVLNLTLGMPLSGDCVGNPNNESISTDRFTLLHTHWQRVYEKGRWQWDAISDTFVVCVPTIVPLRDPLLSLLTRHNRDPWMYPHGDLLEEWIRLANCRLPLTFFKMDLFTDTEFAQALSDIGLTALGEWLETVDIELRPNTSGQYALKDAYNEKNIAFIRAYVPSLWERLCQSEYLLRPFLEQRGYTNLIWWSDYRE